MLIGYLAEASFAGFHLASASGIAGWRDFEKWASRWRCVVDSRARLKTLGILPGSLLPFCLLFAKRVVFLCSKCVRRKTIQKKSFSLTPPLPVWTGCRVKFLRWRPLLALEQLAAERPRTGFRSDNSVLRLCLERLQIVRFFGSCPAKLSSKSFGWSRLALLFVVCSWMLNVEEAPLASAGIHAKNSLA